MKPLPVSDTELLGRIAALPGAKSNFKHLVREFGARGEARARLEEAIGRMLRRGELIELRSGHFVVAGRSREFATGRLRMHRDGYGFLIAAHPLEGVRGDLFIPPEAARKAMHGDRVVARVARIDAQGKAEGEIVRVLERAHLTVVGEFRAGPRGNFVIPHDERIRQRIGIPEGLEIPQGDLSRDRVGAAPVEISSLEDLDGMIVSAEILEFPDDSGDGVGRVVEVLGRPGDFGLDVEIVIRKYHIPHRFPGEVLEQARAAPAAIAQDEIARRRDFRALPIVTIDGETARDFDDAVYVERLANGNYLLQAHIADVAHYVRPGTPLDAEARLRGNSVYFPDRAVPMLPPELSTGICSLQPGVDRLVMSVLLEIDHAGDVVAQEFARGVIRSAARMTYSEVHALLEGDAAVRERYASLAAGFERMRELALILNRKRARRGSLDFDLPEPLIEFDEWGEMSGIARSPRNVAHRIIEEFMLAANEAVARHLEAAGRASLYRIHEPPDPARVEEFERIAARFGYSLGAGPLRVQRFPSVDRRRDGRKVRKDIVIPEPAAISPRLYQKLAARLEGKPEERILGYLMLRSLKQARYSVENRGHFALATDCYTHFTSPIRRYPDLVVHRVLGETLDGREPGAGEPELRAIAAESSGAERRADDAERELVEWKKVKFMAGRVGDEFDALVVGTARFGLFVELSEFFVEGLVPLETLPGDRFLYRENARAIIGERTRREFHLGDRLRVCLDRVDAVERKLQFSLAEPAPGRRRGGKPRP